MKNSRSVRFGSMFAYSSRRSVRSLNEIWQMIATRRFHMFASVLQPRTTGRRSRAGAAAAGCSRGGDVARFHGNPTLHLDHPRRSLVEVLAKRRKHPSLGEVLDQLPNDVAVCTQHDLVELGVVEESIRGLEPSAFGQAGPGLD